jgi:serine/threonine-protein kinase
MVRRSATCDTSRLEELLRDRLPADARQQLEAHLFLCPACRQQLDELAGGERWWGDVRRYLGDDGAAEPLPTMDLPGPRLRVDLELDFLEASDFPKSIGRLGGYEVLEVLGRGGWGIVLKAFDTSLHRPVAIKVLAECGAANGTARKRFAREARAAAAVVHDHVVPVYAVNAEATPPYLVMAFIPGQTLQQRIDRFGPLDIKEVLRIGTQTAAGLAAAHAQGLVHRDIKPANIMLENGIERVRITDFGLARAIDDASVTRTGTVAGTPQYMAPEQARGEAVDQRADLFALGSMIYAMCTGQAPFRGDSGMAVIRQVCDVEPRPIRSTDPEVPAWLEGIVRKLHAKAPADRFQSAAEVAELLERCLAHVQHPDRHPLPTLASELGRQVPQAGSRRRVARWISAAALVVLALSTGSALYLTAGRQAFDVRSNVSDDSTDRKSEAERDTAEEQRRALEEMRRSLEEANAAMSEAAALTDVDSGQLIDATALRAHYLRRELFPESPTTADPLEPEMDRIRQRLDRMREQLGVRPE